MKQIERINKMNNQQKAQYLLKSLPFYIHQLPDEIKKELISAADVYLYNKIKNKSKR